MGEATIRRLTAGTLLKLCLFVLVPGTALGLLFGLFALAGFDTVRWGPEPVLGVNGLLLGVLLGLVGALAVALANFLLMGAGMAVVSAFKTTKIQFREP